MGCGASSSGPSQVAGVNELASRLLENDVRGIKAFLEARSGDERKKRQVVKLVNGYMQLPNVGNNSEEAHVPLLFLCRSTEALELLLEHGADVETEDGHGWNLLHAYVSRLNKGLIEYCVNTLKVDLHSRTGANETCLHVLCGNKQLLSDPHAQPVLAWLLENGANPNARNTWPIPDEPDDEPGSKYIMDQVTAVPGDGDGAGRSNSLVPPSSHEDEEHQVPAKPARKLSKKRSRSSIKSTGVARSVSHSDAFTPNSNAFNSIRVVPKRGSFVNDLAQRSETVMHLCTEPRFAWVLDLLAQHGGDMALRNHEGQPLLHLLALAYMQAVEAEAPNSSARLDYIVHVIQDLGCDANMVNANGDTILHLYGKWMGYNRMLSRFKQDPMYLQLVQVGASEEAVNAHELTPYGEARRQAMLQADL